MHRAKAHTASLFHLENKGKSIHFDTLNIKRENFFVQKIIGLPLLYFLDAGDRALSKRSRRMERHF